MDRNAIAKELADLGRREGKHLAAQLRIHNKRCELLRKAACDHGDDIGLESDVVASVILPKEEEPTP